MYKSSFGIVAPPFQLTPDPGMYFDSRGHHRALGDLRRAVKENGSGFVVVSGAIGSGKTMLVRTLVAELDPSVFKVANVVSSQLDAGELVVAASIGFGVAPVAGHPERVDDGLRRLFMQLAALERRAVLIVDEAQHLHPRTLDRLVDLCLPGEQHSLPVQVWLVGQPELTTLIDGPDGTRLRRAIRTSCRLGPIDRAETGPYIEHRLRKVGWSGTPRFEAGAFDEIFHRTLGIPRRINLLCNRLLLSRFLADEICVDIDVVAEAAVELGSEAGEPQALAILPPGPALRYRVPVLSTVLVDDRGSKPHAREVNPWPILCVVDDDSDHVKAAGLLRAMVTRSDLPPAKLLRVRDNDALAASGALYTGLDLDCRVERMGVPLAANALGYDLMTAFDAVFRRLRPRAVVVFDGTAVAFACSTVAHARNIPVAHVGAGLRVHDATHINATLASTDALADMLFTTDEEAGRTLAKEGIGENKVECAGSLALDSLHLALRLIAARPSHGVDLRPGGRKYFDGPRGYALVMVRNPANLAQRIALTGIVDVLLDVSRVTPLVWPTSTVLHAQLKRFGLKTFIPKDRFHGLPDQLYLDYVELLRHASCVVTDSRHVQEEACGLGIPCLAVGAFPLRLIAGAANVAVGANRALALSALWEMVLVRKGATAFNPLWDGHSGSRIAARLANWFARPS